MIKKYILKLIVCARSFVLMISLMLMVCANANNHVYFGLDAMYSILKFSQDFGGNIISKKPAPGFNLFMGYMFNERFGIEAGFESYKKMKMTENKVSAGNYAAGVRISNNYGYWELFKTVVSQVHSYCGVVINNNIFSNNNISLLAGMSLSHIKSQYIIYDSDGGGIKADGEIVRTFSKTKLIPIIKATIEHKFNDKFSVTAIASWKQTSLFKIKSKENPSSDTCIKPRDSFSFGFGVKYYVF
jgi:hypothetical protein